MVSFSGTGRRVSSSPLTSTDTQSQEYGDLSSARSCVGRVHPVFFISFYLHSYYVFLTVKGCRWVAEAKRPLTRLYFS